MQTGNLYKSWRSEGMNDIGPSEMANFRRIEEIFLSLTRSYDYQEIHTPTIEPLHLYTATRVLSPQLLHRVYSFPGSKLVHFAPSPVANARASGL